MATKNILLLFGGGGTEHDISVMSSNYIEESLSEFKEINIKKVEIEKGGNWVLKNSGNCELNNKGELVSKDDTTPIHFVIPCIHGPPGETGDIQAVLDLLNLPYLGTGPEGSRLCFNKITSKLWFSALGIPNTPYTFLASLDEMKKAEEAFDKWGTLFVKAASQGSSVGCYMVTSKENLEYTLVEAFQYSPYVLIEKALTGRELEVSVYEYKNKLYASDPGEIVCPKGAFYSFDEKYDDSSKTQTQVKAKGLDDFTINKLKQYSLKAFESMKLKHLSRIDFFYTNDGMIYLNEINTFPGMTPISMFPKMMEAEGHSFKEFLKDIVSN